ncbi:unnamed protein product [Staurois parvus]|uniref:BPTI/Kunitz inhibitor domain-containing protein n=1 Tax=Staurois parvus TaxID=386267 RepID=A0ABN9FPN8_9NEOB|nr:unnamed protein product [Staurois parvus]
MSIAEYCLAPMKVGRCRGSFRRWYYNPDINECDEFVFGGCKPNKNNYVQKEDCRQTCVTRCVEMPETGSCRASFSRWYYDPLSKKCMGFTYGGCNGNGNNFMYEEECEEFCRGVSGEFI